MLGRATALFQLQFSFEDFLFLRHDYFSFVELAPNAQLKERGSLQEVLSGAKLVEELKQKLQVSEDCFGEFEQQGSLQVSLLQENLQLLDEKRDSFELRARRLFLHLQVGLQLAQVSPYVLEFGKQLLVAIQSELDLGEVSGIQLLSRLQIY